MMACIFKKIVMILARFALAMSEWRVARMRRAIERLDGQIAREVDLRPRLVCEYRLAEGHYMASVIERSQKPRRRERAVFRWVVSRPRPRPCAIRVPSP